jgi:hypothetical protein
MVESNISVVNSYADGIHYTGGSADIVLNGATIAGSGDDYVAVVSYLKDERYCERITIKNVSGSGQLLAGRGLTVVGGKDITYEDCQVTGTVQFGLYVASEAANNTYGTRNVTFRRCSTLDTGTVGTANIGDSIRVTGRSGTAGGSAFPADLRTCENTTFEQCSGTWTLDPENAGRTIGDCNGFSFFANSTQVTLQNCSIKNAKRNGIEAQGVTGVSINLTVVDTPGQYGIALSTPVNAAPASISNVQLIEINARQTVFSHAIRLDTGNPAPAITGTTHTQPTGRAVSGARFISAGAVNNGTITSCTSPWVNALGTGWTIT